MRMGWFTLFTFFSFGLFCFPVWGQDLYKIVNSGLEHSYELKKFRESIITSRIVIREKQGYFNPSIDISGYHSETEQVEPSWLYTIKKEYSIGFSQPIYNPSLTKGYKEAALRSKISEIQFREIKDKLVLDIMTAVFRICRIISQKSITEKSLKFVERNVRIQKKLLKADYGSRINIMEAEVELARYQKEYQDTKNQLKLELLNLTQLTQLRLSVDQFPAFERLTKFQLKAGFSRDSQYWIEEALKNSTKLALIRLNQEIGMLNKVHGYDSLKPDLDLIFTHTQTDDDSVPTGRVSTNLIKLNFSISFSPFNLYYQSQRLNAEQNVLFLEEKKVIKELEDQVGKLLEILNTKDKNLQMQKIWVLKQEEIIGLYQKGLKKRHFSFSRVLNISRIYNESQLELTRAEIDIFESKLQLFYLSGLLDKEAIDFFNRAVN